MQAVIYIINFINIMLSIVKFKPVIKFKKFELHNYAYSHRNWRNFGAIHRVTVTSFRSISMPAGFRRHFMGRTPVMFVAVISPKYALLIS